MEKAQKESKKRFDFKLIKLVKEYPALYSKYHEDFHNKPKKDWLWQSIGQKCGKSGINNHMLGYIHKRCF